MNYTPREAVDGKLIESLARDQHIVIYGSSKQGKTCLRKWNLKEEEYIVVTCANRMDLAQLHSAILKQAGFTVELSNTMTVSGHNMIMARTGAKLKIPMVGEVGADAGGETGTKTEEEHTERPLELDPEDVNDIIAALKNIGFDKYIVLEDFHYLPQETQTNFAVALKAFHEGSGYCFIVVGVWLDKNRLIQYNGDLAGRVIAIDADAWSPEELTEVVSKGEKILNLTLPNEFKQELVDGCFDSVSVVQEACYRVCDQAGLHATRETHVDVQPEQSATDVIRAVVDDQSARYNGFITNFASGFRTTELEMYKWILLPVLTADVAELEKGLTYKRISKVITSTHPLGQGLNPGNLTQALQFAASLQVKYDIKPIILDYDQSTRKLNVVDRGFLIWLNYQDRTELLAAAELTEAAATVAGQSGT